MQCYNPDTPRCTFKTSESSLEAALLLSLADLAADFQCFFICHNSEDFNNTQSLQSQQ